MKCNIVKNGTETNDAALRVLLAIAWTAAYGDRGTRPVNFKVGYARCSNWRCRWKNWENTATLLTHRKHPRGVLGGVPCHNFNELFAGMAAWSIAGILRTRDTAAAASEAIYTVRERGQDIVEAMDAAMRRGEEREKAAFAREIMRNMERDSLEYKLKQIEAQEKIWLRKSRLAETKLKKLRRRRSALVAADKRCKL